MKSLSVSGYFADINGDIFSMKNRKNRTGLPFLMKSYIDADGYKQIVLRVNDKKKRFPVHRLVCEAFHGKPSADKNICMHLNGDPSDNRPENLMWGTQKENKSHEAIHGTKVFGEASHLCKYSVDQIVHVKKLLVDGYGYRFIAEKTGVDRQMVQQCASGKTWSHIPFPGEYSYSRKAFIKLTVSDVKAIKEMLSNGLTPTQISKQFGVHRITIHDIKVGRTWNLIN